MTGDKSAICNLQPAICLLVFLASVVVPPVVTLAQEPTPTLPPRPTVAPTLPPRPTVGPTLPPRPTIGPTLPPRPTIEPTLPPRPTLVPTGSPTPVRTLPAPSTSVAPVGVSPTPQPTIILPITGDSAEGCLCSPGSVASSTLAMGTVVAAGFGVLLVFVARLVRRRR